MCRSLHASGPPGEVALLEDDDFHPELGVALEVFALMLLAERAEKVERRVDSNWPLEPTQCRKALELGEVFALEMAD
jgi:hypothetical protein